MILLPPPPKYWDHRCVLLPQPPSLFFVTEPKAPLVSLPTHKFWAPLTHECWPVESLMGQSDPPPSCVGKETSSPSHHKLS